MMREIIEVPFLGNGCKNILVEFWKLFYNDYFKYNFIVYPLAASKLLINFLTFHISTFLSVASAAVAAWLISTL